MNRNNYSPWLSRVEILPAMNGTGPEREPSAGRDDAGVGRAFRRSLVVLLLVCGMVAGVTFLLERKQTGAKSPLADGKSATPQAPSDSEIPVAKFTDITAEAGLTFVHNNGAYGDKLLPETMGGGVAFFDFDNDGAPDLLFINSTYWPGHVPGGRKPTTAALYHNDGKGRFTDFTAGSGLDVSFYGKLDLFVGNYVQWSKEIDFQVDNRLVGVGRAYGRPMNFPGTSPRLHHNDGGGRFSDVSVQAGIRIKNKATGLPMAKTLGVAPVDLDGDGWIDLVVANDTVQNFVFHNERTGTFKEIGAVSGLAFDNYGGARGAMGIDAARIQEDNSLGISIGNFANEMTAFYVSQNDPLTFTDQAVPQGIGAASRQSLTFGIFFFDYDLDGWLDLLTANGHLDEDVEKAQPSQRYRQPAQLFWNARGANRQGGFTPVPPEKCGGDIFKPLVGRGSAFADIDGDGDSDVVLTQINGPPLLLRNDQHLPHHWLRFKLIGTTSNHDAIGAWVKVRVNGRTFWRQVMPTRGYLSQSELPVTFGLGKADRVEEATVIWPDGSKQKVNAPRLDALNVISQSR